MKTLRHLTAAVGVRALARLSALLALTLPAAAAPILSPSTTTVGGIVNATQFIVGTSTNALVLPSNSWPTVQGPNKAVDGVIGAGNKYSNLNVENTAIIFRGTVQRVASRLELWVAEDAVVAVEPAGKSYRLTLRNGLTIPVSLSYRGAVQQHRLLAATFQEPLSALPTQR